MRTRKLCLNLIMFCFLIGSATLVITSNTERARVMILHSYNVDYAWTREVNKGIARALNGHGNVEIRYHYMDTKNHPDDESLRRATALAKHAIDSYQPQVLIAFDDIAQSRVAGDYINRTDLQIVFAGVNGGIEQYGYHQANNVTGVLERKSVAAIQEVVQLLQQTQGNFLQLKRTQYLSDTSTSARLDAEFLSRQLWGEIEYQGHQTAMTFKEWKTAVKNLNSCCDFVLMAGYRQLRNDNGGFVPAAVVATWTEANSPVPIIGMNVFNAEDGLMLAVGVSPYAQGRTAIDMALSLVEQPERIQAMEVTATQDYILALRERALERREIVVPKVLESFARATNHYFK